MNVLRQFRAKFETVMIARSISEICSTRALENFAVVSASLGGTWRVKWPECASVNVYVLCVCYGFCLSRLSLLGEKGVIGRI